jgi:MoxR-like ATPase
VEKLKHGVVEYVPSPVTIWDKELVLIDELNRAVPELQSKWLEIIRSRKIMGFQTQVKWVWAAMNPMSYSATNALDAALVGGADAGDLRYLDAPAAGRAGQRVLAA